MSSAQSRRVVEEACVKDASPIAGAASGVVVVEADTVIAARDDEAARVARVWAEQGPWRFTRAAISSRPFNLQHVTLDGQVMTEEQRKQPEVARLYRSSIRISGV